MTEQHEATVLAYIAEMTQYIADSRKRIEIMGGRIASVQSSMTPAEYNELKGHDHDNI